MRRAFTAGVVAAGLLFGGSAQAATTISTPGPYQRWADGAKVPTPRGAIEVKRERCPSSQAWSCTYPGTKTIYLHPYAGRQTFLHELGHQFDYWEMDDAARTRFMAIAAPKKRSWQEEPNPPSERFGEGYELCALKRTLRWRPWVWTDSYRPTPQEHETVCRLIRRAYAR